MLRDMRWRSALLRNRNKGRVHSGSGTKTLWGQGMGERKEGKLWLGCKMNEYI